MAKRGPRKHLKRLSAPKHWMLSKVGGIWATKPSQGPHKLRECVPLNVILRNKLKLALTNREAKLIVMSREGNVAIDGKIRKDTKFPVGFMGCTYSHKVQNLIQTPLRLQRQIRT